MPCGFDCPATLAYSDNLLAGIRDFDPDLISRIEGFLKQTFLVASERLCYRLADAPLCGSDSQRVRYRAAESLHRDMSLRDTEDARYLGALAEGNELSISDGVIFIWRDGVLKDAVVTQCDQGVAEVPLVLQFQ